MTAPAPKAGWLDRENSLNGIVLGQTMPSPLAAQVSMWVGLLQRGAFSALAVAMAFISPLDTMPTPEITAALQAACPS